MGVNDSRRFPAFASFIHQTYPAANRIADVAGGNGRLSFYLRELGFEATVIDSRDTNLPNRMRRMLRKESIRKGKLASIPKIINKVEDEDLSEFDLLVALHPDEATEHVIRMAIALNKDFAVIPCCVFPIDGIKRSHDDWRDYLTTIAPLTQTAYLPIEGDDVVLYRTGSSFTV